MRPGKPKDPIDQWFKFLCLHIWTKGAMPLPVLVREPPADEAK